ncbi:MAG: amino acid adenylation domain-containing protein, partial [Algicola sp.]|nr:amino acid adenylation domain-containing protein [Algicola sp.]
NSLPMVLTLVPGSWRALIAKVMEISNNNILYRHYPLATIGQDSGLTFNEVLFNYTHFHVFEKMAEDASGQALALLDTSAFEQNNYQFTVDLQRSSGDNGLSLTFSYNKAFYSETFIDQLGDYFITAADALLADIDSDCYSLSLLSSAQSEQLLSGFNATQTDYPANRCVHQAFEAQVARAPQSIAVEFESEQLTYDELNRQANQLAHHLMTSHQVKPDTLVGICLERSPQMVVSVLAVLKAGGAYVPLEPDYPASRLAYMIDDAQLNTVITVSSLLEQTPIKAEQALCLDGLDYQDRLPTLSEANLPVQSLGLSPDHLAYVIYTSGSTGKPKGVSVVHRGVMNYLDHTGEHYYPQVAGAIVSLPLAFDATVTSLLGALVAGKWLHLLTPDGLELEQLGRQMSERKEPALFKLTPAHLEGLAQQMAHQSGDEAISQLDHLLVIGGEQFKTSLARTWQEKLLPQATLINEYGPTETVVGCSTYTFKIGSDDAAVVPIGKPVGNTQLLVLGQNLAPVGIGMPGQLYIGGAGLARGYLNRDELTRAQFIANPFYLAGQTPDSERLYKTGDLVRWLPCGNLEFLGRMDSQVKIRGFLIELGEIEHTLAAINGVSEAVVQAKILSSGDVGLVAYVVSSQAGLPVEQQFIDQLRHHISEQLPQHMVPAAFVLLAQLPLTANGKLDRRALPEPDMATGQAVYVAPRNDNESVMCGVFQEVLGLEQVGIEDNFFSLGGDSILSIRLVSLLKQADIYLSVKDLFTYQTIAQLSVYIDTNQDQQVIVAETPAFGLLTEDERAVIVDGNDDDIEDAYPLSTLQAGMVFHTQLADSSGVYHDIVNEHIVCPWDQSLFDQALTDCIAAHPILRSRFDLSGTRALQLVYRQVATPLVVEDIRQMDEDAQQHHLQQWQQNHQRHEFDWAQGPLFQVNIFRRTDESFVFALSFHHSLLDGWSRASLTTTLYNRYQQLLAIEKGAGTELVALAKETIYREYIALELRALQSESARDYFIDMLVEAPSQQMPMVTGVTAVSDGEVNYAGLPVTAFSERSDRLIALAANLGVPVQVVLQALHFKVLASVSGLTDVMSNVVHNGRPEITGGEQALGLFLNSLPMMVSLTRGSWRDLINQVMAAGNHNIEHRHYPLATIAQDTGLTFDEVLFNYTHFHVLDQMSEDAQGEAVALLESAGFEQTNYHLTVDMQRISGENGLLLHFSYDSARYDAVFIGQMGEYFVRAADALLADVDSDCYALSLLSPAQSDHLLHQLNTTQSMPIVACVHQAFEAQVDRAPQAIAVEFEDQQLTYGELNRRANQLADHLVNNHQVKPDTLVGICLGRSFEMVVAILAVLKAGGAYVPLDPDYPASRLAYMLGDSKLKTVITESALLAKTPISEAQALCLDGQDYLDCLATLSESNLPLQTLGLNPGHLAYVIYTSGSTGQPKGVMVSHANVHRLLSSTEQDFNFGQNDCFCLFHSFSFDFSVWELWGALTYGGRLVVVPQWVARAPQEFYRLVQQSGVTILNQTPSAFVQFSHQDQSQHEQGQLALRAVIFGGEALKLSELNGWVSRHGDAAPVLVNMYGITETTVHVTYRRLLAQDIAANHGSLIGRPLADLQVYVLDRALQLAPLGTPGEMYVGGPGVTRGYLNNAPLTAERFIDNPYSAGERLYRTGDLACYLPSGELEYKGRIDEQVKIRGFRIELGEIENVLAAHQSVSETVVLAKTLSSSDIGLVAYVVSEVDSESDDAQAITTRADFIDGLRRHASEQLPQYMVPAVFVLLPRLPLTTNGKLDRRALPEPDMASQQAVYVAPVTDEEKLMCEVWQQVLGLEQVGINDNFFELGGHSLLVMQVISRLQQAGCSMTARQLFLTPTLVELVASIDFQQSTPVFKAADNLIEVGAGQITPAMLPLVELTEKDISRIVAKVPDGVSNIQDIYPLGPLQQGILFHHMMSTNGDPYVLPLLFKANGEQAVNRFLQGLAFIVDRHDALRTVVLWNDLSVPVQVVCRRATLPVTWLEPQQGQDVLTQMQALCAPEVQQMDMSAAPLLAVKIMADPASGLHYLLLQFHHLICDHVGLEIIQQELLAYERGEVEALATPMPYREFIAHAQYQGEQHDAIGYFSDIFGDVDEPTLAFNLTDVQGDGSQIVEMRETVPPQISHQLREVAKSLKVSPAVLFHTAWAMLIGACSGRDDVVFGTVVSGRLQGTQGAQQTVGVFINTLPLRVKLKDVTVTGLVAQVQRSLADLLPYEQASLALAQRSSNLPGDTPLFNTMLNYRHTATADLDESAPSTSDFELLSVQERTNFPFNLAVDDLGVGFELDIQVDSSLSAQRIGAYIQTIIRGLVNALSATPQLSAVNVSILPQVEVNQLLHQYNATQADYPARDCVHEVFEAQVKRNSQAIAVVFEAEQLSYEQLNCRANQLAHHLVNTRQVLPDTLVGICLERSLDMMIAILAVLKAGGAYVPMDPDFPAARLAYMLDDAQLDTVITHSSLLAQTAISETQALCLDAPATGQDLAVLPESNLSVQTLGLKSSHLAYVIYTSGSTGHPKGVMVEHHSAVNFLFGMRNEPGIKQTDCLLAVTSTSFDIHILELLLPLISGCKMVVASKEATMNPLQLAELINTHAISMMQATPATWKMLLDAQWQPQRAFKVLCGGEALSQSLATDLLANEYIQLWNMYGPTETTIWSSTKQIHRNDPQILLGRPIANTQFYVVSNGTTLSPVGVPGELLIGGCGLARGYFGKDQLTAEQFIDSPFYHQSSDQSTGECPDRLYKTGDLVRWLADGQLEYLGRLDHQVKIRGFRVELGEVQAHVLAYAGIKDAVVVTHESTDGSNSLVCYVVADNQQNVDHQDHENTVQTALESRQQALETELRNYLYGVIPGYMVPGSFILLDKLPLTPNGKIDTKALPRQDLANLANQHVPPETPTEKILCQIWQEVLDVERVGLTDNFFQLGGHSLLAMKLLSVLKDRFNIDLAVNLFFELPDLQSFAAYLATSNLLSVATETSLSNNETEETVIMENFKI